MKYFRIWCLALIGMVIVAQASAQATADVYKVIKANTGQSYLLAQANTDGVLYTDIYFRIGTIYELDSVSGISVMITHIIDARINAALKGRKISYHSTTDPEQLGFHFESTAADLDYVLTLAYDKIMNAKYDEESIEEAKAEVRADLDSIQQSEQGRTDITIKKSLWGKDFKKLNVYGDKATYKHINVAQFNSFQYKYFLPLNNMIVITGTFPEQETVAKLQNTFKSFKSKEFNPELIRRVIEFKPIINSIQVMSKSDGKTIATVTYQGPGAREDRSATYAAFMLAQLINDDNGRIARSMQQTGITHLQAKFDCNNFQGSMTISAVLTANNYVAAFGKLDSLVNSFKAKDYFNADELKHASGEVALEFEDFRKQTDSYMTQVAKYRFSNDENYFPSLSDSMQSVTVPDMQRYISDYFVNRAGIKCLYANPDSVATAPDGQRYFALDESIKEMKFTYDNNKTDIESDTARQDLQRLIQWLTINPDMNVQINGFSDHGEYSKSYDTTITRFIRNTPTFRKAMPDAIRVGYLRIEMMRAMKIAKALYEAGISEDRITGTSMVFTSDSPEAAAANRKCTVTLEKIQPRISLYEYHFGKKKDDTLPSSTGQ